MGALIEFLKEHIFALWPVRIIDAGNQGILWKHNGTAHTAHPGFHLIWPKLWRMDEYGVQEQNIDCGIQSLTTADGKAVTLSLNIGYSIADIAKLFTSYQHFDTTLVNMARGHAAALVPTKTWAEISGDAASFAEEVLGNLQEDFGEEDGAVLIETAVLDQLSTAPTLRLFQSTSLY